MSFESGRMLSAASARMFNEIDLNEEEEWSCRRFGWMNSPGTPVSFHLCIPTEPSMSSQPLGPACHSPERATLVLEISVYTSPEARQAGRPLLESSYQTFCSVSWPELRYKSGTKHGAGRGDHHWDRWLKFDIFSLESGRRGSLSTCIWPLDTWTKRVFC